MYKRGIQRELVKSNAVKLSGKELSFDVSKVSSSTLRTLGQALAMKFEGYNWVFANENQSQLANIFSKFTGSRLYYPKNMEIPFSAANQKLRIIFLEPLARDSDIIKIIKFFEINQDANIEKISIGSVINGGTEFYHPSIRLKSLFEEKEFVSSLFCFDTFFFFR